MADVTLRVCEHCGSRACLVWHRYACPHTRKARTPRTAAAQPVAAAPAAPPADKMVRTAVNKQT